MKAPFFHLALCAIVCLIYTHFNRAGASSLPPAGDYKLENRHYARTFAANLDVGEPRTVRMIYFLPKDRPYRAEVVQRMKDEIRAVQTFFAEQMEAHSYGNRTFSVETDSQGEPMVHRIDGEYPYSYYRDLPFGTQVFTSAIQSEIIEVFDFNANVVNVIIIDNGEHGIYGAGGIGESSGKASGAVFLPGEFTRTNMAHELGHAFGLHHDFRDETFIMSYGQGANRLSPCSARYLSVHPHFNPDTRIIEYNGVRSELISPEQYPVGVRSVSIQLKVKHLSQKGLHQAILLVYSRSPHPAAGGLEVKECRELVGDREAIIEFDYDGIIPSDDTTSLSDYISHPITIITVDTDGNIGWIEFYLTEISPHLIATLEGHQRDVNSVLFSPDGRTLAAGNGGGNIQLWDVVTRQNIATLEGYREGQIGKVMSISFSPDGKTLAAGGGMFITTSWVGDVKLWDVVTQQNTAILEGFTGSVHSVAFSPDGKILATSGGEDRSIKLWDMATQQNIDTFGPTDSNEHNFVISMSFSPDGSMLISGSHYGVYLWDMATRQNIDILQPTTGGISFSPDGQLLASGSHQGIHLWDMVTRQNITILGDWLFKPTFSPDGRCLAVSSGNFIYLWDVEKEIEFATLVHTNHVNSISFSPDGITLAAGIDDGKIEMWDISVLIDSHFGSQSIIFDVNSDGVVNILDLTLVASSFENAGPNLAADVNGDEVVNIIDLVLVVSALGDMAAAPSARPQALEMLTAKDVQQWLTDAKVIQAQSATIKKGIVVLGQLLASLIPVETVLLPNYPNPFNPETWIPYRLAEDADVTLDIYDANGKLVRSLDIGHSKAGIYESRDKAIYWDGKNDLAESVASGVYFYHLMAGGYSATRRMVILK